MPDGWGWSSLSIRGEGLVGWRSVDGDWWDDPPVHDQQCDDSTTTELDDSFSTMRQRRSDLPPSTPARSLTPSNERSAASLMRQPVPADLGRMEEFSFEMSNTSIETARTGSNARFSPYTPTNGRGPSSPGQLDVTRSIDHARRPINGPAAAKLFDLMFAGTSGSFVLEGVLAPMSRLTLVTPSLSTAIPFVRIDNNDFSTECTVVCSKASLAANSGRLDFSAPSIGTFQWADGDVPLAVRPGSIDGDVVVRIAKDTWGATSLNTTFIWPKRATEVGFIIPSESVRVVRATRAGVALPRAKALRAGVTDVRIGSNHGGHQRGTDGTVEIVLEVLKEDETIVIPQFEGRGRILVELRGDWGEFISCLSSFERSSDGRLAKSHAEDEYGSIEHKVVFPFVLRTASLPLHFFFCSGRPGTRSIMVRHEEVLFDTLNSPPLPSVFVHLPCAASPATEDRGGVCRGRSARFASIWSSVFCSHFGDLDFYFHLYHNRDNDDNRHCRILGHPDGHPDR